jgi:hypothetical protein
VAYLRAGFDILDGDDSKRLIKRTMKAMNIEPGEGAGSHDPLKQVSNRISRFKDNLITPDEAPAQVEAMIAQARATNGTVDPDGLRMAARVYLEYQRRLREGNAADFGDLLLWPTNAIEDIEAEIDRASEFEALRHRGRFLRTRDTWDRPTWRRYSAEAMPQRQLHAMEIGRLRQEAAKLEQYAQATAPRAGQAPLSRNWEVSRPRTTPSSPK